MKLIQSHRRLATALLAGATLAALSPATAIAQAGPWPSKPIRIVVPFPPGGAVDLVGRAVSRGLSEGPMKAQAIVDNRPGAGAMIGTEAVAKSAPDGYTLLIGSMSALAVNTSLYKSTIRYDPMRDFTPIALVATTPGVLAVNPKIPATSLAQLIQLAKSKPGMTYASSGNGNFQHLIGELFKNAAGIDLLHVPYKGSAPALADAIAGQVDMIFDVVPTAAPPVRAGQLRGLAVTGAQRSDSLPDLPTMSEAGLQGFDVSSWYGLVAPAGTPADIVAKLNAEVLRMLKTPEMLTQLRNLGATPIGSSAAEFVAHIKAENARWAEVIRVNKIMAN